MKEYELKQKLAVKEKKKRGKARGGVVLAVKRNLGLRVKWEEKETEKVIAVT